MSFGHDARRWWPLGLLLGALALLALGSRSGHDAGGGPVAGARSSVAAVADVGEGEDLNAAARYWDQRLTYPTGHFDPAWLRRAARQDAAVPRRMPAGTHSATAPSSSADGAAGAATLAADGFTSLGPAPVTSTGCTGCYSYTTTSGRINALAVDPTTTAQGSITAYAASVGGGVWKTTTCCTASTTWSAVTDDPLLADISVDAIAVDPKDPQTVYAGTGDGNYGSFAMGSQGMLKSTDGGATWSVVGADVFTPALPQPAGHFPQYQAIGKVAVDPNDDSKVVAGTKTGVYVSYDKGADWTGPCLTNTFTSQRQDITGLALSDVGGTTRVLAAVGVRGFASPVQDDLGNNGANGLYVATMPASGCPSFTSIAGNGNGFVFGTAVGGSPYATGAAMNAASGTPYSSTTAGDQIGRVEIAVAPSDPDVIYAQVMSLAPNSDSGCGNAQGCQLGVWASTDGGTSWSFLAGSAGGSLRDCHGLSGDYPQNWYDQALAVDPTNPDRVFVSTFDVWFATRTGTSFNDISCGYSYQPAAAGVVHVDQHALVTVPGVPGLLLAGNDGGVHAATNADTATSTVDPSWLNLDAGLNDIEFYSGDISAGFATSAAPVAVGGAQDNGSSSVTFTGSPTGPVGWQMGMGGDGFVARLDPVGGALFEENNSGHISRCTANCTSPGATWTDISNGTMLNDVQSFVQPYDIFKGTPGNPGGRADTDCAATTCGHVIAGTVRVWENLHASGIGGSSNWYVDSPANLTKQALGNRSYINQLAYSPATDTLAIVGTNDGNVWLGRNLGTGSNQAVWTDVTGGNTVLPNRPVLDVAFRPDSMNTDTAPMVGYAAVGGFDANTPSTPGHLFQVACSVDCASSTWTDKTGNLPDIPVDSVIVNPRFPQQVYAGTDFGLYFTDDITATDPVWYRFDNGLPSAMVWDMQIDRGATTLSVWTRGRGAYVWPLPSGRLHRVDQTVDVQSSAPASATYGSVFTVTATATSGLPVTYGSSGACSNTGDVYTMTAGSGSCQVLIDQPGDSSFQPAPEVVESVTATPAASTTDVTVDLTTGNPAAQVGDTVRLTATVAAAATQAGDGHFSGTVAFTVGGQAAGGAVDVQDGAATASVTVPLSRALLPGGAATVPVVATFTPAGGANYAGSESPRHDLRVVREGALATGAADGSVRLDDVGVRYVATGTAPKLRATLSQSLAPEAADTARLSFASYPVKAVFSLVPVGCTSTCPTRATWHSSQVRVGNAGTWASNGAGTVAATAPKTLAAGAYLLQVKLVANPYVTSEVATAVLDVAPRTGRFVAGGGYMARDSTSNTGTRRPSFGFTVQSVKGRLRGASGYVYRMRLDVAASTATRVVRCSTLGGSCHDVDVIVRSAGLTSLAAGSTSYPRSGDVVGRATVQVVDAGNGTTHFRGLEITGGRFRLDLVDRGTGSRNESYGFTVYRRSGSVYHQCYVPRRGGTAQRGTSSRTNRTAALGGNLTAHPR
ncbi:MAG TPA: hypothetical protein VFJ98_01935 [Mycobacteriales bacterium]|nr:hypothetical protein [Mycobacteriales bacterium]